MEPGNKPDASSKAVIFSRSNPDSNQEDVWDDRSLIRAYDRTVSKIKAELGRKMGAARSAAATSSAKTAANEDADMSCQAGEDEDDDATGDEEDAESNGEQPPIPRAFNPSELKKPAASSKFSAGDLCMAVYSEDGLGYPGRILKTFTDNGSDMCRVQYLHYLNEEDKPIGELYEYQSDSEQQPPARQCDATQQGGQAPSEPEKAEADSNPANFLSEFSIPPPPLPLSIKSLLNDDKKSDLATNEEALHAMLMSWYMSGYHTGYYLALNQATKSNQDTKARK